MRIFLFFLSFLLLAPGGFSQNSSEYFKVYSARFEADLPDWAEKMYADDPNFREVQSLYKKHYREIPFVKTVHSQNYKFWKKQIKNHLNSEGLIRPHSAEQREAIDAKFRKQRSAAYKSEDCWTSLGPFETYDAGTLTPISWQVNVYSLDVAENNPNKLIAGTEAGGVFISEDKGLNWNLVTQDEDFCNGITAVKIHPTDENILLVSARNQIYRSVDNGDSWEVELTFSSAFSEFKFDPLNSDRVFAIGVHGLLLSEDSGDNWTNKFPQTCWDLEFHPENPMIAYLLKSGISGSQTEFFRSVDGANTWTQITDGWYDANVGAPGQNQDGAKLAVSPDDPNRVYAALVGGEKEGDNGWIGLYRSDDAGESWYLPAGQVGGPYQEINTMPWNPAAYSDGYHQGYYNFDLEVSAINADRLWLGTVRLTESLDGGFTYQSIGAANSTKHNLVHADIQDIEVRGEDIWIASDGGIDYSDDELDTHDSRKNGIFGSEFWGFGMGWNEDVMVGGKYHNGNSAFYQNYSAGDYHHVGGVEEWTGYVNPLQNRRTYFNRYWTDETVSITIPEFLGGDLIYESSVSLIPNEPGSGLFFDKRYADHVLLGEENRLMKSTDGGSSFDTLYTFDAGDEVLQIERVYGDPDFLYCTVQPGPQWWVDYDIYKSTDGGTSWTKLLPFFASGYRYKIAVNPTNKLEIWAISDGTGNVVFQSIDGGLTWINRSDNMLTDNNLEDIVFQGGSDVVYVAGERGVFYFDKSTESWNDLNIGLPFIANGFKLYPFYKENKLRLATYGRGIWEIDMVKKSEVVAQAMCSTDRILCSRDTVLFDSYSIVEHEGAEWTWGFQPEPAFIDDANKRNPRVLFSEPGTYDVQLVISQDGVPHFNTQEAMVTVESGCEIDTVPGMAMKISEDGDYAQIPNLELTNVSEFTVSAWIKVNGFQNQYSGIVMADGEAVGLNFQSNNQLAYHWPNGEWWWESGLQVPTDVWSYVAMTVSPNQVTLYLNDKKAVTAVSLSPADIGSMKIGSYQGWSGRNGNFEIDEVCIWDRTLSQEEIRLQRHLTKNNLQESDENLVAYYQFNYDDNVALDRIGSKHASLVGNSSKESSVAPVGSGVSELKAVNFASMYQFNNAGMQMDFSSAAVLPQEEVVVTQIYQSPPSAPVDTEGIMSYWIINNYGVATATTAALLSFDSHVSDPSQIAMQQPNILSLKSRPINNYSLSWLNLCQAQTEGPEDFYNFGDCSGSISAQYFIERNDSLIMETGIEELAVDWKISPNPVADFLSLPVSGTKKIYGLKGQLLMESEDERINVSHLAHGTYFLKCGDYSSSFVKE